MWADVSPAFQPGQRPRHGRLGPACTAGHRAEGLEAVLDPTGQALGDVEGALPQGLCLHLTWSLLERGTVSLSRALLESAPWGQGLIRTRHRKIQA